MQGKTAVLVIICCWLSMLPGHVVPAAEVNWLGHWKGEEKRETLVHEIKKEFEFLHPGTVVNLSFDVDVSGSGEYYKLNVAERIVEMITTGKIEWDLFSCDIGIYGHVADLLDDPLWGKKYLVDFAEVPGFLASHKEAVVGTSFYKDKMGGIFAGPYVEGLIFCLWYTREAAEKLGITVKDRGMTVDEFLGYAEKVAAYNVKHGTRVPFLYLNSFNRIEALFEHIFRSQLAGSPRLIEETYDAGKVAAFLATLEVFEKLARHQPLVNAGWRTLDWRECEKDFLAGNGLFLPGGTYMYSHFRGIDAELSKRAIPVEMPHGKQPNGLVGLFANTFAVFKDSPNLKAAIDLSMMWADPRIAEKWVDYTKNPTGLKGHLNPPVFSTQRADVYDRFILDMEARYGFQQMRNFRVPTYAFGKALKVSAEEFRGNLVLILEGKRTAREYFQEIVSRTQR